ncbi:Glycosyltransferase involved in cell wall bisynthesis [Lutibacter agarilyticus]|uniref:Glycosyltransferase involved in cell wall bisynthesis n=1 Tax=Lutibacter agarilyticus TaxID=1109740 RepID=A0A238YZJ1_9FLAO|nr:glycosyltransferase [Lutibacter agarilyticus]SNR76101.1 Glycosyltransferase involved in cell wall bisynthesis [Lutibacter agarilyticus]
MEVKKNILFICWSINIEKGIGTFFWEQAVLLKDKYNVRLCVFNRNVIGRKEYYKKHHFGNNKITFSKEFTPNNIELITFQYRVVEKFSKSRNLELYNNFVTNSFSEFYSDIDIIHAQCVFNAGIEAFFIYNKFKIPYVITEHNQFSLRHKSLEEQNLIYKVLENSKEILVVSNDKSRQFIANGFFYSFKNVGNLVNSTLFNTNVSIKKSRVFRLITIGAYHPIKNQKFILDALKIVDKKITCKIIFTWIGFSGWGTDKKKNVEELISNYNLKNIIIELEPSLNRKQVSNKLKQADLFLFSSLSEGMPVSVLEALACGVPVCSTNFGGVDEIINSNNGLIVQIMDYESMANYTVKVINKEIEIDKGKISEEILRKFGESPFKERIMNIYSNLIDTNLN